MPPLDRQAICDFANREIVKFHESRLERLRQLSLDEVLLKKNPYLFRAKGFEFPSTLVHAILDAFLSSSEEEIFGRFLEELAVFVAEQTSGGKKSSAQGVDLEFDRDGVRYIVAVKSGPNWGNSSQYRRLEQDFKNAITLQKQSQRTIHVQAILGSCYGRARTKDTGVYIRLVGQSFWHFLSGDEDLYLDIIEPIGYQAKEHNLDFGRRRDIIAAQLTSEFAARFCTDTCCIDWSSLVAFNSGNLGAPVLPAPQGQRSDRRRK